ncbi:MAG: hypothetical protein VW802_06095 [Rhodospirillaceae bacterium]|jgi:Na+/melibiose symporter-like transporter
MAEQKDDKDDAEEKQPFEVVESELDEKTHAEVQLLYRDSSETVLFAKSMQWKTVGSTLVVYIILIVIAKFISKDPTLITFLKGAMILSAIGAIYTLFIYQFWQHDKLKKLKTAGDHFSNLFRNLRDIKSRKESNVHRYTLLTFMVCILMLGGFITFQSLARI